MSALVLMRDVGYTEKTIETYLSIWNKKWNPSWKRRVWNTIPNKSETNTFPDLQKMWCKHIAVLRRSITILNAVLETGRIKRYVHKSNLLTWAENLEESCWIFCPTNVRTEQRMSTLYVYERMLGRFLTFLRLKGIETMSALAEQNLLEFVDSAQINKSQRVSVLKGLCYYLVEQKLVPRHFDTLIKGFQIPWEEKLPSVYTEEEISQIGKSINRNEFGGKRLYAIFMLTSSWDYALQTSEILNLRILIGIRIVLPLSNKRQNER